MLWNSDANGRLGVLVLRGSRIGDLILGCVPSVGTCPRRGLGCVMGAKEREAWSRWNKAEADHFQVQRTCATLKRSTALPLSR